MSIVKIPERKPIYDQMINYAEMQDDKPGRQRRTLRMLNKEMKKQKGGRYKDCYE